MTRDPQRPRWSSTTWAIAINNTHKNFTLKAFPPVAMEIDIVKSYKLRSYAPKLSLPILKPTPHLHRFPPPIHASLLYLSPFPLCFTFKPSLLLILLPFCYCKDLFFISTALVVSGYKFLWAVLEVCFWAEIVEGFQHGQRV